MRSKLTLAVALWLIVLVVALALNLPDTTLAIGAVVALVAAFLFSD